MAVDAGRAIRWSPAGYVRAITRRCDRRGTLEGRRPMAELTKLEDKLGEVLGLARAAQDATAKVVKLVEDDGVTEMLGRMREEAIETARRCEEAAGARDGKKTGIIAKGRETKGEAAEMMGTYLGEDAEGLDGLEFLTMAEAGEVGHWEILARLAQRAGDQELIGLATWALPIQERHLADVRSGALRLADQEDPTEPA
jgi:hypothetical protein